MIDDDGHFIILLYYDTIYRQFPLKRPKFTIARILDNY